MPLSKRYATTQEEWAILLARQNTIITDLLGEAKFYVVTGEYNYDGNAGTPAIVNKAPFDTLAFIPLQTMAMHAIGPETYDENMVYRTVFAGEEWLPGKFDPLLKAIAEDQTRAFFVGIEQRCLIAPYDGGMDFVLKDTLTRDTYKKKYKGWLSQRADGL